jgi:hypothetical protein
MRSAMSLWLVAGAVVLLGCASATTSGAGRVDEKDLTGAWDGDAGQADDWGEVNLKLIEGGYIGTYSATFNKQLGSVTFERTGEGKYKGRWWESDLKRYGTCELEVSKDGGTVTMTWKALDDRKGGEKGGKSTWKRKAE